MSIYINFVIAYSAQNRRKITVHCISLKKKFKEKKKINNVNMRLWNSLSCHLRVLFHFFFLLLLLLLLSLIFVKLFIYVIFFMILFCGLFKGTSILPSSSSANKFFFWLTLLLGTTLCTSLCRLFIHLFL